MSLPFTRIPLLSASRVSRPYTEQIGLFRALIHELVLFAELTFGDCFKCRWVECQVLNYFLHHYWRVVITVHI